jgi:hypothetical protein
MPRLAGNKGLVFRGYRINRNPSSGRQTFAVYSGPAGAVLSAAASLDSVNESYNIDGIGPRWLLERDVSASFFTSSANLTREERLHYNRISKPLINHPSLAAVSRENKDQIRRMAELTIPLDWEAIGILLAGNPDGLAIADLIFKGEDHFIVNQATVTVTLTSVFNYTWTLSFINVGRVFTTAQLRSDAALISNWALNLPQDSPDPAGYQYGWVKHPPEIQTAAGDRSQLVTEYEYGLWNSILYPPAS